MRRQNSISAVLASRPYAMANIKNLGSNNNISGKVKFFPWAYGTLVQAEIVNLPEKGDEKSSFFAIHIHSGSSCQDPKGHFNPLNTPHPSHAGDLPVLLSNNGYALMIVYTDRFTPKEILGKTVIIHADADDFRSQPSGNSGEMIACGEIMRTI